MGNWGSREDGTRGVRVSADLISAATRLLEDQSVCVETGQGLC